MIIKDYVVVADLLSKDHSIASTLFIARHPSVFILLLTSLSSHSFLWEVSGGGAGGSSGLLLSWWKCSVYDRSCNLFQFLFCKDINQHNSLGIPKIIKKPPFFSVLLQTFISYNFLTTYLFTLCNLTPTLTTSPNLLSWTLSSLFRSF